MIEPTPAPVWSRTALPPPRRTPDASAAREALHRALRLLEDDPADSRVLAEARAAAQLAAESVPYRWEQPHCAEYRRNAKEDTCRAATCTRCAAYREGDPRPLTGW